MGETRMGGVCLACIGEKWLDRLGRQTHPKKGGVEVRQEEMDNRIITRKISSFQVRVWS